MLDNLRKALQGFLGGDPNQRTLNTFKPIVSRINELEQNYLEMSDEQLQAQTDIFRQKIKEKLDNTKFELLIQDDVPRMPGQIRSTHDKVLQETLEEILPEAFAVCREASKRVLNMRHFDVQLMGGVQLHRGGIAEMATGEGKTLVCTLPAYLNGLTAKGVHVVTVNDYLAKRDSEWMGQLYKFLGLTVGLVTNATAPGDRKAAYQADICYGTNNEFGFDYLRDNMESSIDDCVQRPYFMSIVDEVDSILIDEARTPLIISGMPDARKNEIYQMMDKVSKQLKCGRDEKDKSRDAHYYLDEKSKNVILTDAGIHKAEEILKVKDLWAGEYNLAHHLIQALRAKELYVKDVDYIVKRNDENRRKEVVIVDEFTGRLMEGRRWGDGLHQAVEAKEAVNIQEETLTMASITFQNLFRLYPKLSGMTGTAITEADEFEKIYNLSVLQIPTNKPCIRKDLNDVVYKTEAVKFFAIAEDIVQANKKSQPVLVGTTSIDKSEQIAQTLTKPFVALKVLEFRLNRFMQQVAKSNKKLSEKALKLLDKPANLDSKKFAGIKEEVDALNISTEDFVQAFDSVQSTIDVLDAIRSGLKVNVLNAKHHKKEAEIVKQAGRPGAITIATNMAGRGTDIVLGGYKSVDSNEVDSQAQELVKKAGGLYVVGSERHESRRIDNQLRGRASRQGDPGQTRFYLSLEDNLMRIFGGEKVISVMNILNADEDMPIEAGIINSAINSSQKKVEAHNFDIRKHILQYDDVTNTQREVIYRERREILEGKDISDNITEMIEDHVQQIIFSQINPNQSKDIWFDDSKGASAFDKMLQKFKQDFGEATYSKLSSETELKEKTFEQITDELKAAAMQFYAEKEDSVGLDIMRSAERQVMLHVIDMKWIAHIQSMDSLKEGVHLQSYGQKDPLIEYKKEAFDMFDNLLNRIRSEVVVLLFHSEIVKKVAEQIETQKA